MRLSVSIERSPCRERAHAIEELLVRAALPGEIRTTWAEEGETPRLQYGKSFAQTCVGVLDHGLFEDRTKWRREAELVLHHVSKSKGPEELRERLFRPSYSGWVSEHDLVAVVYGLLNRWEEDLSSHRDEHGRWPFRASLLAREKLVSRPVCDWIARAAGLALRRTFGWVGSPARPWGAHSWAAALTFDIDSNGMYRRGNAPRTWRRNQLQHGMLPTLPLVWEGLLVQAGRRPDPHDNYDALGDTLAEWEIPATFFVQAMRACGLDNYDLRENPGLVRALRRLQLRGHAVGLHGSAATSVMKRSFAEAQTEMIRCLFNVQTPLHRAHYLCVLDVEDWDKYADAGLRADASEGFSEREGFRLGTSFPVARRTGKNSRTVYSVPLHMMDVTLKYHRGMAPGKARRVCRRLFDRVRRSGGLGVLLWHPHNLEPRAWRGWTDFPFEMLEWTRSQGAELGTLPELLDTHDRFRQRFRLECAGER